jgi:ribose/xylose/arabinose/galactoside ABC-type transport system permease subunit
MSNATASTNRAGFRWWRNSGLAATNFQLIVLLVLLLSGFSFPLGEQLFSLPALQSMGFQMPEMGILALAMMVTLLSGGVDLSIIATANLASLVMAYFMTALLPPTVGAEAILFEIVAVAAGLVCATLVGALNGFFVAYVGVSPILATLGSMSLVRGLEVGVTHGDVVSGLPDAIVLFGNGIVAGIPVPLFIFVATAVVAHILISRTAFGTRLAMIGSNERAVRFSGIDTRLVLLKTYMLASVLSGVAGFLMLARFNSANASYGESYLLVTILAAVLGGVDPTGGFGRVSGVVLGLVVLQVISTAFNLLDLSQFLALAIWGGTLIAVASLKAILQYLRNRG